MKLRKFQADTMKEAVAMVKATLGPDAMIVATRPIRRGFLGSGVEVTAALDTVDPELSELPMVPIRSTPTAPAPRTASSPALGPPTPFGTAAYAAHASSPGTSGYGGASPHPSFAAHTRDLTLPSSLPAPAASPPAPAPSPVTQLSDADVERIMAPLRSELRQLKTQVRSSLATRDDEALTRELLSMRQALSKLGARSAEEPLADVASRATIAAPSTGRVVALVGPTGAGKTTTIAKLAARAALGRRQRVALVSVDTFRVGGEEQIRIFADLIGVPLVVVRSLDGLKDAVDGLAGHARVFIDTAGRSPKDGAALDELSRALAELPALETHLTLPAGSSATWIDGWTQRFPGLRLDRFLFTKVDEADQLGELVRAPVRHARPVSFFTTGQHVPEDLEEASHARLLALAEETEALAA
jgi:flagellar biosynthesis protein FlhF